MVRDGLRRSRMKVGNLDVRTFSGNTPTLPHPGKTYFVSRNITQSGDGLSWEGAFKTFTEAIDAVNTDATAAVQPDIGRGAVIYVGEGWYAEEPMTLTAGDVHIIGVAPGSHDSIVIYGVPVAGTFSGVAGAPTLQLTCANCTIENIGFFCSDPLFAAIQDGGHASDSHLSARANSWNNRIVNCSFVRDTADGELGGVDCVSNEGPYILGCRFSTSCKDWGVRVRSNGSTNPVGVWIQDCHFVGTPTGIELVAGHNIFIDRNFFYDDSTDRDDTTDIPLNGGGIGRTMATDNFFEGSSGDFVQGTDTNIVEVDNHFGA